MNSLISSRLVIGAALVVLTACGREENAVVVAHVPPQIKQFTNIACKTNPTLPLCHGKAMAIFFEENPRGYDFFRSRCASVIAKAEGKE